MVSRAAAADPNRPHADYVFWLLNWGAPPEDIRCSYHEIPCSERHLVVSDLTERGRTAKQIAQMLGTTERSVARQRATARAHAEQPAAHVAAVATADRPDDDDGGWGYDADDAVGDDGDDADCAA